MIFLLLSCCLSPLQLYAQQVYGISSLADIPGWSPKPGVTPPGITIPRPPPPTPPTLRSYHDTQEDYIAAYYYDVATQGGIYYGTNSTPVQYGQATGNPDAGGYLQYTYPQPGMWFEGTAHYLIAYYIGGGEYYDPFGYSNGYGCNNCGDDGSGSQYWFYAYAYLYVFSQDILLGETFGNKIHQPNPPTGPGGIIPPVTVLYNAYIPPDWIYGPYPEIGGDNCEPQYIYLGDNRRGPDPSGGSSFRVMQMAALTPGGPTGSTPLGSFPLAGISDQFDSDVTKIIGADGLIPVQAFDKLHDCHWLNNKGQASTANMQVPNGVLSGGSETLSLTGRGGNPLSHPQPSPPITWNYNITVTPEYRFDSGQTFYLKYSIPWNVTCFPAHELDINGSNVMTYVPPDTSPGFIFNCLTNPFSHKTGTTTGEIYSGSAHLP